MKILTSIYEKHKFINKLVLILIETIVSLSFQLFLMSLHAENKLNKIIFNECYLIVTIANYRHKMYKLKKLRLIIIQFLFLFTTLFVSVL